MEISRYLNFEQLVKVFVYLCVGRNLGTVWMQNTSNVEMLIDISCYLNIWFGHSMERVGLDSTYIQFQCSFFVCLFAGCVLTSVEILSITLVGMLSITIVGILFITIVDILTISLMIIWMSSSSHYHVLLHTIFGS